MKKTLISLALVMGFTTLTFGQKKKDHPDTSTSVLEMVVYEIKAEALDTFPAILEDVKKELGKMKGFISHQSCKSTKTTNTFMDLLEWESKEYAMNAASKVHTMPAFKPFFEATEKVLIMDHFTYFK